MPWRNMICCPYGQGFRCFCISLMFLESNEATVELVASRPVIGVISVDNYDDLEDATSDSDISHINSFVANLFQNLLASMLRFLPCGDGSLYVFTDYTVLEELMNDKFSVTGILFEKNQTEASTPNFKYGIFYGDGNHEEIGKLPCSTWT